MRATGVTTGSTTTCIQLKAETVSSFPDKKSICKRILISGLPFVLLLIVYSANGSLKLFPTPTCTHSVKLHNVTAWERTVLPVSIHHVISAWHFLALDVLAALLYLAHYLLPLVYPVILLVVYKSHDAVMDFFWLLGASAWLLFIIWYYVPTAPPWFNSSYHLPPAIDLSSVHMEGGAFARLDRLTGVKFFRNMFANNPAPFAAFPSGHVMWPTCILVTIPSRRWWWFSIYVVLISWATMYTGHHYFADAVGAVVIVIFVRQLIRSLLARTGNGNDIMPKERQLRTCLFCYKDSQTGNDSLMRDNFCVEKGQVV